jgi:DcuC family C4-dicarboxylate transporter
MSQPDLWQQLLGALVIVMAVWAISRQLEVRLTLLVAAAALGLLAGTPHIVLKTFLSTFSDERFVVPICCSMGFSYVLKHTGCDQHLVHLLLRPLTKARFLLVPGTVIVGYLVNIPIVSQASTAATLGAVAVPLLRAANVSPVTTGAALLLGCSIGGELLNPGAPELRSTVEKSKSAAKQLNEERAGGPPIDAETFDTPRCVRHVFPLSVLGLFVATAIFWALSVRAESGPLAAEAAPGEMFRVNPLKAMIPLLPLVFLYLTMPPFQLFEIDHAWLEDAGAPPGRFESRLIGAAMLLGAVIAALTAPRTLASATLAFCQGGGFGFTNIISLIVSANCFGTAIGAIGFAAALGQLLQQEPGLLYVTAGGLPMAFSALCGSGMATTQSFVGFFTLPALRADIDPTHVGALVSLTAAAGRTMSPVAAVVLLIATMTGTEPLHLVRRVALPLLAAVAAMTIAAMLLAPAL